MLLLSLLLGVSPGRPQLSNANYRMAAAAARQALERNPDEVAHHATLANALARMGRCTEALDHYAWALGDPFYDQYGVPLQADCLRMLGRPDEAAEVRATTPINARSRAALAVDLAHAGRFDEAFDALDLALAWEPGSPDLEGARARVFLAMGELEQAEASVWVAQRLGPSLHTAIARVQLEDDPMGRLLRAESARTVWPWNPDLAFATLSALIELDQRDAACRMAGTKALAMSEHPGIAPLREETCPPDGRMDTF
jgi:tetratricopeptide (TPR) repeat protein